MLRRSCGRPTAAGEAEAAEPGWIAIRCATPAMAAWLAAAIVLENVEARAELPLGC